jgi:putative component of toxin-antitoxin plasmid stabilization module
MQPEWRIYYLDDVAFAKFLQRYNRLTQGRIERYVVEKFTELGIDAVADGSARPLGQGLYELKVSLRPEVEIRVFFAARGNREIVILSAYDKKSNDSKNWQNVQIQAARRLLKSIEEK